MAAISSHFPLKLLSKSLPSVAEHRGMHRLLLLLYLLAWGLYLGTSTPTYPGEHLVGIVPGRSRSHQPHLVAHDLDSTPVHYASTLLLKRIFNLQLHHVKIYQMVIPIRFAATYLHMFYARIIHECLTSWHELQPQDAFRIVQGRLEMTLHSIGGPIPWSLIREIAVNMQALTVTGFVGTYDLIYTDNGNAGVLIQFRIQPGAPRG